MLLQKETLKKLWLFFFFTQEIAVIKALQNLLIKQITLSLLREINLKP